MSQQFIIENAKGRERLHNLVNNITDKELTTTLYEEGWTIAVALAHLAFWDKRRLVLVRKWKQEGVTPTPVIDEDLINDTLVPFLLAIPPRKAAELATLMAETLDHELEEASPDLITAIEALGDRHALNRSIHRKMHLDDIEALLKTKRP